MNANASLQHPLRRCAAVWLALIALMLASLGSAYLPLGALNAVAGLAIAALKAALVIVLFMRLGQASTMARLAAAGAVGAALLLPALAGIDYATRPHVPAPLQAPQQLPPLRAAGAAH